ncbi:MAG: tRNA guanosine(15) transglycosylase TgtA [Candidatus Poseidoniia archaeon]|nr:tRNA guanosine(15) transglycosylase TgtA [Candidatus Poseidoniia archaeon]
MFEINKRDGLARLGKIKTPHGVLETPTLLPVVNPKILTLSMEELAECGAHGIITNSYIIYKNPGLKKKAMAEGIHAMLGWEGPIMTDSGTFQSHVYGEIDMEPDVILDFQKKIGADIGTVLDVFTEPGTRFREASKELEETQKRIEDADKNKGEMMLAAPIQGGRHLDLRSKAASDASKTNAELFPIGGVVPLMEQGRFQQLVKVIFAVKKELDISKPVHLFGCGHPILFALAVFMGCDVFDSSSYAKFASRDSLMFTWGTRKLDDLEVLPSEFSAAPGITIDQLKAMESSERQRIIAKHNLIVSFTEIRRVRQAIHEGTLWELVENRLRCSPVLMKVFDVLKEEMEWLSQFEPAYRYKTPVKTGKESDNRPIFAKFVSSGKGEMRHPYFGNISLHLSETYPFHPGLLQDDIEGWKMQGWDSERVKTILDYQFGKGMGEALTNGDVGLVTSRKTKRLRNLMLDGKHLASLSHRRGLFILQEYGAEMIQRNTDFPRLRVIIDPETAAFNRDGKSVFCKFVKDIDQNLRCMDECVVVTPDDKLVAFGKLIVSPKEIELGQQGMAVRVRGGMPDQ